VETAVPVPVFLGADEHAFLVVLDAIDFVIAPGGDFDAFGGALRIRERPGVLDAILRAGEADLFKLLTRPVVLPAIDSAVFVLVDLNPENPGALHVAEGVELAVAVGVVAQELEPARLLVVRGLYLLCGRRLPAARGNAERHSANAQKDEPQCRLLTQNRVFAP